MLSVPGNYSNCLSKGRYCSIGGEGSNANEVKASIRQKCAFLHSRRRWFELMRMMRRPCTDSIGKDCLSVTDRLQSEAFKECIQPLKHLNTETDRYKVLDEDREEFRDQSPPYLPSLVINTNLYSGPFEPSYIVDSICEGLTEQPESCLINKRQLPYTSNQPSTKRLVKLMVGFSTVLVLSALIALVI